MTQTDQESAVKNQIQKKALPLLTPVQTYKNLFDVALFVFQVMSKIQWQLNEKNSLLQDIFVSISYLEHSTRGASQFFCFFLTFSKLPRRPSFLHIPQKRLCCSLQPGQPDQDNLLTSYMFFSRGVGERVVFIFKRPKNSLFGVY